jgi:GntR family phosphonate transport system transcriptional regulator
MMTGEPRKPGRGALPREDGVTLWRQIAITLEREIAAGDHKLGARLPTEAQLSQRFDVNRHTVRRALEDLSRRGLIRVEQGRGSFVAEETFDYEVGARTRFSEWVRRYNREPVGRVLDLREVGADAPVAAGLGLRAGARVARMVRLGLADDVPVSLTSHHFPLARLPGVLAALRDSPTITAALNCCGVVDYLRQSSRLTARLPQPREADLLHMPRSRPMLVAENINVDRGGTIVEYGVARFPTPRVQLVFEP